jgi:hypothetical protein
MIAVVAAILFLCARRRHKRVSSTTGSSVYSGPYTNTAYSHSSWTWNTIKLVSLLHLSFRFQTNNPVDFVYHVSTETFHLRIRIIFTCTVYNFVVLNFYSPFDGTPHSLDRVVRWSCKTLPVGVSLCLVTLIVSLHPKCVLAFGVTRSAKITSLMLLHGRCHNRVTFSPFITVQLCMLCVCVCMYVCV